MQEASTLLSALATALSNCKLTWPALVPVHDPLRDAYWGVAAAANATTHFDTDSIHISRNPTHLQKVDYLPISMSCIACSMSHTACSMSCTAWELEVVCLSVALI